MVATETCLKSVMTHMAGESPRTSVKVLGSLKPVLGSLEVLRALGGCFLVNTLTSCAFPPL